MLKKINEKDIKRVCKLHKKLMKIQAFYHGVDEIDTDDPEEDKIYKQTQEMRSDINDTIEEKMALLNKLKHIIDNPEEKPEEYKNIPAEEIIADYEYLAKEVADYLEMVVDIEGAMRDQYIDIIQQAEEVISRPKVVFENKKTAIPSHRTVKSILNAIYDACEGKVIKKEDHLSRKGWYEDSDIPTYEDTWGDNESITIILNDKIKITETLQKKLSSFREIMSDIFIAILYTFLNSPDPHNGFWVRISDILDYRGLTPVMKDGKRSGHRKEDREEVIECIKLLDKLTIKFSNVVAYPEKGRKKTVSFESKIISIMENTLENNLYSASGFKLTLGEYGKFLYGENKRQTALISEKTLHYSPYKEKWEKRISYYLTFQWKIKSSHGTIDKPFRVETLLREAVREEINRRFPARVRDRLEKALDNLVSDGEIKYWEYEKDNELPVKNWLPLWLNWNVKITPPEWVENQYCSVREKRLKIASEKKKIAKKAYKSMKV